MIEQINATFDNLVITKPLTKEQMISKINLMFDSILIKVGK